MEETWKQTPIWRANLAQELSTHFPSWTVYGRDYLSWVWVDTKSITTAAEATRLAKENGVPIRSGQPGYELPTYIRIAVRNPEQTQVLMQAWKSLKC